MGFLCDPCWINNQEVNLYRIWLPGLQPLDELSAASWKYNIGMWNSSKREQHFHRPARYLCSSSSMTSGPKSLVSVTQEVRLYDLQLSFLLLIICNEIFFTWTLRSCKCLHQLVNLPHNHSPFPQVTMAPRLPRCCPEMIQRISFILTAQLFVILSRSSKAINWAEGEHFKAH